jgi:hypothetical protein
LGQSTYQILDSHIKIIQSQIFIPFGDGFLGFFKDIGETRPFWLLAPGDAGFLYGEIGPLDGEND